MTHRPNQMQVNQTIIDPQSGRVGKVAKFSPGRVMVRLEQGGYFWLKLTPWGEPVGGKPNPELLAIASRVKAVRTAAQAAGGV